MQKHLYLSLGLVLAAALFTAAVYAELPALVPSHWNAQGVIDAYIAKDLHVYGFLALCTALPLLMIWLPKIDPKYANIKKFEQEYSWFVVLLTAFMIGMYLFTTFAALGYTFPIQNFIIPAMSILFFAIGRMLEHAKINYMIGFRLPWTLNNEKNWNMTHRLAAKSLTYGAFVLLATTLIPTYAFTLFMGILAIIFLVPTVYSYWLHTKGI